MRITHISDIHFNFENFKTSTLRNKLLSCVLEKEIKVDA